MSGPGKLQTWDGELVLSETAIDADSLDDLDMDPDSDDDWDQGQALPMQEGKEMDDDGYLLVVGRGCVVSAVPGDAEVAAQSDGRFASGWNPLGITRRRAATRYHRGSGFPEIYRYFHRQVLQGI